MSSQVFWQDLATFALLGLALCYVVRRVLGLVGGGKAGSGCGSCGSCASAKGQGGTSGTPQVVTIGGIPGRKTV